jgi:restriction system protein
MKSYYKIMLGKKSMYASECLNGNFIGGDYSMHLYLTPYLFDDWRDFNHQLIPVYIEKHPAKSKIAAGLACGTLWTICKGLNIGDIVLCPNGHGKFMVGEIIDDYKYFPGEILPHRRSVKWLPVEILRSEVSDTLRSATLS